MSEAEFSSPILTALDRLSGWLESAEIPYALIGGVAVSILTKPRATNDIDLVVWLGESSVGEFSRSAEAAGFPSRITAPLEFAQRARILLLRNPDSGVNVDLSLGALPFEKEMIEKAEQLQLGRLKLRVPRPEDLIITKALPLRPQDMADIDLILTIYPQVNFKRIRSIVKEFQDLLDRPEYIVKLDEILRSHET